MKKDSCDFPAAHSMDTAWFAVDRDGHVAVFATGEAGAVPTAAYLGDGGEWEMLEELREKVPRTSSVHDFESRKAGETEPHVRPHESMNQYSALMFLESLDKVRDLVEKARAKQVATTVGVGLVLQGVDRATLMAFHERDACLGCYMHWADEEHPSAAEFGLYSYDHTTENWISGPYALHERPEKPITVNQVPASIAEKAIKFPGRFADTPRLQPAEVWACESWEPNWLASDGKTVRPFPGREKEHEEARKELEKAGMMEDLVFVGAADVRPQATTQSSAGDAGADPGSTAKKPWWKLW
jgi:hypothetical protein